MAVALAALIVLILVAAQIILSTDLPRNLVVDLLQKQLGLRIEVKSLSTGWLGHTTLRDVSFALPLTDRAFLSVPTMEVKHSPLLWLILTRSLRIHEIAVDNARLDAIEDPSGNWNIQEVAQLVTRPSGASDNTSAPSGHAIPELPQVDLRDVTLVVTDKQHRSCTIGNLSFTGRADGPLVWECRAVVPGQLDLNGKIALGGVWAHEFTLNLHDIGSWISPWIASWPGSARVSARWSGEVDNGQIAGRLTFDDAVVGSNSMSGAVEIALQGDRAMLRPAGLLIANSGSADLSGSLEGGQITLNGNEIDSQQLSVAIGGGLASLDGKFILADRSANLRLAWRDIVLAESIKQSGSLTVAYTPSLGQAHFNAVLASHGSRNSATWDSQFEINGTGNSWQSLSLALTAQKFRISDYNHKSLDLSGLAAEISSGGEGLELSDIHLGDSNPIAGFGGYAFGTRTGWLYLDARGWGIPGAAADTLDLNLNAWCDPTRVHLAELYLNSGSLSISGDAEYVFHQPKPVAAHLYFAEASETATTAAQYASGCGVLHGNVDLAGTLIPADLTITGAATGTDIHFGQRPLGNVSLALEGNIQNGEVWLASRDIEFLGGSWYVAGHWPVKHELLRLDTVRVRHLSLPLALARDDISGQLDGGWFVDVEQLNPGGVFVEGSAAVSGLAIRGNSRETGIPVFAADQIQCPDILIEDGDIHIKPILLTHKISGREGRASAELSTTLDDPTELSIKLDADSWAVQFADPRALCLLWAKGNLDIDLLGRSAVGHLDLRADSSWKSQTVARMDASVDVNRRQISATQVRIQALGGSAAGNAEVDIDRPYQTRAQFDWKGIDLSRLESLSADLSTLSGKVNGSLRVAPATDPRPLEPLAVALHVHPADVQISGVSFGDVQAFGYVGSHRFVLDTDPARPSQIAFAGGVVQLWGRMTRHSGDIFQSLLQINLRNLDLDAIMPPGAKVARTPGLLSGTITILGRPQSPDLTFGEGHLVLSQSDLAGSGPIAALYNLMHLGHDASKPRGYGTIDFSIQHKAITVTALRYFDQGAEVHAAGVISEFLNIPQSSINVVAVGSARPLKSIDLPGLGDIDEALSAVQRDAFTVHVTGPLNKPKTSTVLFSGVGQEMQNLLLGGSGQSQSPN